VSVNLLRPLSLPKAILPTVKFLLVGSPDYGNPNTVPEKYLKDQNANGFIEWIEHVDDVKPFIVKSDVVVLPSYREDCQKCYLKRLPVDVQ
jgi:hypothetical protein